MLNGFSARAPCQEKEEEHQIALTPGPSPKNRREALMTNIDGLVTAFSLVFKGKGTSAPHSYLQCSPLLFLGEGPGVRAEASG